MLCKNVQQNMNMKKNTISCLQFDIFHNHDLNIKYSKDDKYIHQISFKQNKPTHDQTKLISSCWHAELDTNEDTD